MDAPLSAERTTGLLKQAAEGDEAALNELSPRICPALRSIAERLMQSEPNDPELQPTMLVDDVLLALNKGQIAASKINKRYFYGAAATIMQRKLIDHSRVVKAQKRGGGEVKFSSLSEINEPADWYDVFALKEVEEALAQLRATNLDAFTAFFMVRVMKMSQREAAERLDSSKSQVQRWISLALVFLENALRGDQP